MGPVLHWGAGPSTIEATRRTHTLPLRTDRRYLPPMSVLGFLLVSGRLAAAGLACGLNLYVTIALMGVASRVGWIDLPPGLIGLEQWLLILGASALLVAELLAAAIPLVDAAWEGAHTIVRPIAAGALAIMVLEAAPVTLRVAGGLVAAGAALAAHSAKLGLRLVVTRRRSRRLGLAVIEGLAAAILAIGAIAFPRLGSLAVLLVTAALAWSGRPLWRASVFAARAIAGALRGFFGTRRWTTPEELPAGIRSLVPPPELGLPEPRAARVALASLASGPWRNGWLVVDGHSTYLLYRHRFRTCRIELPRPDDATVEPWLLADVVSWQHEGDTFTLHMLKDGPAPDVAVRAMQLASR